MFSKQTPQLKGYVVWFKLLWRKHLFFSVFFCLTGSTHKITLHITLFWISIPRFTFCNAITIHSSRIAQNLTHKSCSSILPSSSWRNFQSVLTLNWIPQPISLLYFGQTRKEMLQQPHVTKRRRKKKVTASPAVAKKTSSSFIRVTHGIFFIKKKNNLKKKTNGTESFSWHTTLFCFTPKWFCHKFS